MFKPSKWAAFWTAAVLALLAGCGGGGSGSSAPPTGILTPEQRSQAISAVEEAVRALPGSDPEADSARIAALMKARAEFEDAGVDADSLSAWGRLIDGRLIIFANNRPATATESSVALSPAPSREKDELPGTTAAYLADTLGDAFTHPTAVFALNLGKGGYKLVDNQTTTGRVEDMKTLGDLGAFYLDGHGGHGTSKSKNWIMSVSTGTGREEWRDEEFEEDLNSNALVYMVAEYDKRAIQTRYGITEKFIRKYIKMAPNSVVFLNACHSDNKELRSAFLDKGASVFLGWSTAVDDRSAYAAAIFAFDRILGTNKAAPVPARGTPPRSWAELQSDLKSVINPLSGRPYGFDPHRSSSLNMTFRGNSAGSFTPIITKASINESTQEIELIGLFGPNKGLAEQNPSEALPGTAIAIKSWTSTKVIVQGDEESAEVVVRVDGRPSNTARVNRSFTLTGPDNGPFTVSDNCSVQIDGKVVYSEDPSRTAGPRQPIKLEAGRKSLVRLTVRAPFTAAGFGELRLLTGDGKSYRIHAGHAQAGSGVTYEFSISAVLRREP